MSGPIDKAGPHLNNFGFACDDNLQKSEVSKASGRETPPEDAPEILLAPIRWRQAFRSSSLVAWMRQTNLPICVIDAVDGQEWVRSNGLTRLDRMRQKLVSGRDLSTGEIGASLSHRRAYDVAGSDGILRWDWLVVLEDDVAVSHHTEHTLRCMLNWRTSIPTLVNLQPGGPSWRRTRCKARITSANWPDLLIRVSEPPPFAQAYAINRAALAAIHSTPKAPVTPPDWPPWASRCLALVPVASPFLGEEGQSVVDENDAQSRTQRRPLTPKDRAQLAAARILFVTWAVARTYYPSIRVYLRREVGMPVARWRLRAMSKPRRPKRSL